MPPSLCVTPKPRRARMAAMSACGTLMPSTASIFSYSASMTLGVSGSALTSARQAVGTPQPSSCTRCSARSMAKAHVQASMPFSKRAEESERCPSAREVFLTLSRANFAASKNTSRVSALISELSPPMMPASATPFFLSQMSRLSGVRVNCFSSSVTIFSPCAARRTMTASPSR